MSPKSFRFWQRWLTYSNIAAVIVGFVCAFAGNSIFLQPHNDATREVFFGGKPFPPEALLMKNWLFGIIGGTIVGFHLLMIGISEFAFKKGEKWAYWTLVLGLLSWFAVDSSVSIYYGAVHNVTLINLVALIGVGLPLVASFRHFHPK